MSTYTQVVSSAFISVLVRRHTVKYTDTHRHTPSDTHIDTQ